MNISQREARRLLKRVRALEFQITNQRKHWGGDYIGVEIGSVIWEPKHEIPIAIRTARKLAAEAVA